MASPEVMEMASTLDRAVAEALPTDVLLQAAADDEPPREVVDDVVSGLGLTEVVGDPSVPLTYSDLHLLGAVAGRRLLPGYVREHLLGRRALGRTDTGDDVRPWLDVDGAAVRVRAGSTRMQAGPTAAYVVGGAPSWLVVVEPTSVNLLRVDRGACRPPKDSAEPAQGLVIISKGAAVERRSARDAARDWMAWCLGECVGVASMALDRARAYACDRQQFGRPVATFQAVAHRLADMHVDLEGSRSLLGRWAGMATASDETRRPLDAAAAYWVPAAARRVCEGAIQVHGGIGFTWELGIHLFYRRALTLQGLLGGADGTATAMGRLSRTGSEIEPGPDEVTGALSEYGSREEGSAPHQ